MDADLDALSRDQLLVELKRVRRAIREHRDSTGDDLCRHQQVRRAPVRNSDLTVTLNQ
jgi:hypothetical protein